MSTIKPFITFSLITPEHPAQGLSGFLPMSVRRSLPQGTRRINDRAVFTVQRLPFNRQQPTVLWLTWKCAIAVSEGCAGMTSSTRDMTRDHQCSVLSWSSSLSFKPPDQRSSLLVQGEPQAFVFASISATGSDPRNQVRRVNCVISCFDQLSAAWQQNCFFFLFFPTIN